MHNPDVVVAVELELGAQVLVDEPHEETDLVDGPLPVFSRDDVQVEILHAHARSSLDNGFCQRHCRSGSPSKRYGIDS